MAQDTGPCPGSRRWFAEVPPRLSEGPLAPIGVQRFQGLLDDGVVDAVLCQFRPQPQVAVALSGAMPHQGSCKARIAQVSGGAQLLQ